MDRIFSFIFDTNAFSLFSLLLSWLALITVLTLYDGKLKLLNNENTSEANPYNFIIRIFQIIKRRRQALKKSAPFLKPYTKILGDFVISNKNCIVSFVYADAKKDYIIRATSKKVDNFGKAKVFVASDINVRNLGTIGANDFWSMILNTFSYSTTYQDLYNFCKPNCNYFLEKHYQSESAKQENKAPKQIININSATEAELTELPGINIALAKKIVSHINTTGHFKSFDDFAKKMKIKPHFQKQLKDIVYVKPVTIAPKKKTLKRILDI